jgi:hypothetical protein
MTTKIWKKPALDLVNIKTLNCFFTRLAFLGVFLAPQPVMAASLTGVNITVNGVLKTIGLTADLVSLYGLADNNSGSNSIVVRFSGDEENFSLRVRGTELDDTITTRISGEAFGQSQLANGGVGQVRLWSFDMDFQFFSVNDSLVNRNEEIRVNGDIRHEVAPHSGDAPQGPPLGFRLKINANDAVNQVVRDSFPPVTQLHPGTAKHSDKLTKAQLVGTTNTVLFQDQITNWDLTMEATHVPEPITIAGSVMGLGVGAVLKRKYAKQQKKAKAKSTPNLLS